MSLGFSGQLNGDAAHDSDWVAVHDMRSLTARMVPVFRLMSVSGDDNVLAVV